MYIKSQNLFYEIICIIHELFIQKWTFYATLLKKNENKIQIEIYLFKISRAGEPEPEPVGAGYFWLLGAGAGATWKKTRSRSRSHLGKKSGAGAGAAWKKRQEPEPIKNLPAPQPCWKGSIFFIFFLYFLIGFCIINLCILSCISNWIWPRPRLCIWIARNLV